MELQSSSINKQEWGILVTAMFYHFLVPEGGHPTWVENFTEKKYQNARSFFWATPVKLINKRSEILFQKVQQIYIHLINMISFR